MVPLSRGLKTWTEADDLSWFVTPAKPLLFPHLNTLLCGPAGACQAGNQGEGAAFDGAISG